MGRCALLLCALVLIQPTTTADEGRDAEAHQIIQKFLRAVHAENLDDTLKLVEAPWYHDGQRILRTKEEVKAVFQKLFEKQDFTGIGYSVKRLVPYGDVRSQLDKLEAELLDQVIAKEDRLALLHVKKNEVPQESVMLVLRWRDGRPAIVGIKE